MQRVSEVMTRDVRFVSPQENLQRAAQMMDELNVGALPVCDGDRLVGMVTDRDITIRAVAAGKTPADSHVDEIMSTDVRWVFEDQPMDDVMLQMADSQIRRVPVVSHDDQHKLIGIVSLGDVVTKTSGDAQKQDVEEVVEMVSSPASPGQTGTNPADVAGKTASVAGAAASSGTGSSGVGGTAMPNAGENGVGAAGASGASTGEGGTGDPQRNYGVGGPDLTGGGLPPV